MRDNPYLIQTNHNSDPIKSMLEGKSMRSRSMNRRRFLTLTALGLGSASLAHGSNTTLSTVYPSASNTAADMTRYSDDNRTDIKNTFANCVVPSIPTRIFSSSNTGVDEARNVLGLKRLTCAGFDIQNPKVTRRQYLRFGGTDQQRVSDLQNIATGAIEAPKLLLAVRGGYGAVRLLEHIDWKNLGRVMKDKGTILAGFSDVTAVQCALLAQGGTSSLAAPMLYSEFGKTQPDKVSAQGFVEAISNPNLHIQLPQQRNSAQVKPITGILWGGNLSVVAALAGSSYMPKPEGGIVFLEDVGEQPYQVERMLYSLYLAGAFKNQQAIVLGAFSRTGEDSYDARYNMSEVIEQLQRLTGLPVYLGLPFGHISAKQSFPLGAQCQLIPNNQGIALEFSDYPTIDRHLIHPDALWS